MDRDTELAREYGKISQKINREVEGVWVLYEKEGYNSWVGLYSSIEEYRWNEIYQASKFWKATFVEIFRKG